MRRPTSVHGQPELYRLNEYLDHIHKSSPSDGSFGRTEHGPNLNPNVNSELKASSLINQFPFNQNEDHQSQG